MTDTKPGWKTTEFYMTIAPLILAALVALNVITTEEAQTWEAMIFEIVLAAGSLATYIVALVKYIRSRTEIKSYAGR